MAPQPVMPPESECVLVRVDQVVDDARADAASAVDRAEAAVALRSFLLDLASRHRRQELSIEEMWSLVDSERQRAELSALIDRTVPPTERQHQ